LAANLAVWALAARAKSENAGAEKVRRKGGADSGKFTGFSWRNKIGKLGLHKSGPARMRLFAPGEKTDKMRVYSPKEIAHGALPETTHAVFSRQDRLIVAMSFSTEDRRAGCCRPLSHGDTVATVRLIHFGSDDCHRVNVLRSAGYSVDDCRSMRAFREALSADRKPAAVFITEREGDPTGDAISLTKSHSAAPVIFFRRSHCDLSNENFDLVIESLTPPEQWLQEIDQLIARCPEPRGAGLNA
jgi:hypothetical protein